MDFSDQEIVRIKEARIKADRARYIKYMCGFFILAACILMFMGFYGVETLGIVVLFFVLFSIVEPQFHKGPNYSELADLLAQKAGLIRSTGDINSNAKNSGT